MAFCIRQNSDSNVCVAYLDNWNDKRKLNLNLRDNRWNRNYRVLAFRKSLYSPAYCGSFFFSSFFQPPSILPTSSSSAEIWINFLLSSTFNCQAICKKNFARSSLIFAFSRIGNLFSREEWAEIKRSSLVSSRCKSIFRPRV